MKQSMSSTLQDAKAALRSLLNAMCRSAIGVASFNLSMALVPHRLSSAPLVGLLAALCALVSLVEGATTRLMVMVPLAAFGACCIDVASLPASAKMRTVSGGSLTSGLVSLTYIALMTWMCSVPAWWVAEALAGEGLADALRGIWLVFAVLVHLPRVKRHHAALATGAGDTTPSPGSDSSAHFHQSDDIGDDR